MRWPTRFPTQHEVIGGALILLVLSLILKALGIL